MTSTNFKLLHIRDERLFTEPVNFAVKSGANSISNTQYNAQSRSLTSHSWQITCPAGVYLDKRVMWYSTFVVKCSGTPVNLKKLLNYGVDTVLSQFPLHEMVLNMTAQINGSSVSINLNDVKQGLLSLYKDEELKELNSTTPTMSDNFYLNSDASSDLNINSPFKPYGVGQGSNIPRGAYKVDAIGSAYNSNTGLIDGAITAGNGATVKDVFIRFSCEEPLLFLSPFAHISDRSALWGVQNINFIFNMNASNTNTVIRTTTTNSPDFSCSVVNFDSSSLTLKYLTPQPNQVINPVSVSNYYETPRFITSFTPITQGEVDILAVGDGVIRTNAMDTIVLNQIPDSLLLFVRKRQSSKTPFDSDSFFPITGIRVNWNNHSGLLSTEDEASLFNITKRNGVNTDWLRYSGSCNSGRALANANDNTQTPLCGSVLKLDLGRDITLEPYEASGSTGAYNLSLTVSYRIPQGTVAGIVPELVCITINSGVFVINAGGTSQIFTAILNKSSVLDTIETEPVHQQHIERLVGGGWLDKLKSFGEKVMPMVKRLAPILREHVLEKSDNKYAQEAGRIMKAVGYGKSGGNLHKYIK